MMSERVIGWGEVREGEGWCGEEGLGRKEEIGG